MASSTSSEVIPKESPQPEYDANGRLMIDGGILEGGGQILRNAAALSCILGIPIRVNNIRAGRDKPGLRPQHMNGLQLISDLCGGQLSGCVVGSTEITLDPGKIQAGQFTADTKTAGSICLLMQAALPCLLFAPHESSLRLKGGTNCDMAPQIDYTVMVFKPIAEKFGMKFEIDIKRRGYFPKGGGEVVVTAQPVLALQGVSEGLIKRGDVVQIHGRSFVAGALPSHLANKVSHSLEKVLKKSYPSATYHLDSLKEPDTAAFGSGLGTIAVAETSTGCLFGGSALGKPKSRAEDAGEAAARELLASLEAGGCTDDYLQDQLILLMTLAKGTSRVLCAPLTLHTKTAIHMARLMTKASFELSENGDGTFTLSCEGIGHPNPMFTDS